MGVNPYKKWNIGLAKERSRLCRSPSGGAFAAGPLPLSESQVGAAKKLLESGLSCIAHVASCGFFNNEI